MVRFMNKNKTKKEVPSDMGEWYVAQSVGNTCCQTPESDSNKKWKYHGDRHFSKSGVNAGIFIGNDVKLMFNSDSSHTVSVDGEGTKGLGYVEWGYANCLPNQIIAAAKKSPYIAPVMKFNSETMYARGPKPKYRYAHLHEGHVEVETVDYQFAGVFIKEQIRQARLKLKAKDEDGTSLYEEDDIRKEIEELNKNYDVWEQTWKEVKAFIENNDLQDFTMQVCVDFQYFNIYFAEIGISMGRVNSAWEPKIVEIRPLKCVHCRLEERDEKGIINYVYYSKLWGDDATLKEQNAKKSIIGIPALDIRQAVRQLRARTTNRPFSERVFRYCLPVSYASVDKEYYPDPAYTSIFRSSIYDYADKLIADKSIIKKNDNSWGKIVYINGMYMQKLYEDAGALKDLDKKKKVEDKLYGEIDNFLACDENNGKPLMTYTIVSPDGKEYEAVKIVNAPSAISGSETKSELEEVASIFYAAQDMHPSMNGAVPGKSSQTGGTQIRELLGTKNVRLEPMRDYVLKFYSFISAFNRWDDNLCWEMPYSVLTTLDRNKTGIEENKE